MSDDYFNLQPLLDRPIAYHRVFVDIAGSVATAVFLSQALYWHRRVPVDRHGWFYKSNEEWSLETGLTRHNIQTARKTLQELGIMECEMRSFPRRAWYRLNIEVLKKSLLSCQTRRRYGDREDGKGGLSNSTNRCSEDFTNRGLQDLTSSSAEDSTVRDLQDLTSCSVKDSTNRGFQDLTSSSVKDSTDRNLQGSTGCGAQDPTNVNAQDPADCSAQDLADCGRQDSTNCSEQDPTDYSVQDPTNCSLQDATNCNVLSAVMDLLNSASELLNRVNSLLDSTLIMQDPTNCSMQDSTNCSVRDSTDCSLQDATNCNALNGVKGLLSSASDLLSRVNGLLDSTLSVQDSTNCSLQDPTHQCAEIRHTDLTEITNNKLKYNLSNAREKYFLPVDNFSPSAQDGAYFKTLGLPESFVLVVAEFKLYHRECKTPPMTLDQWRKMLRGWCEVRAHGAPGKSIDRTRFPGGGDE